MSISLIYYSDRVSYNITNLIVSTEWSGDVTIASRSVNITLKNTLNGSTKAVNIIVGKEVRLFEDGKDIFRGTIFSTNVSSDGNFQITANDANHYLTKNTDSQKFVAKTATQIIKSICKQYEIPMGNIDNTGFVIPKLILRDKSIYDMITIALTETKKKTGKVFLLSNEKGKLVLHEQKKRITQLNIADAKNLISASYSESIEDLKNSVRLTGKSGEDAIGVIVKDEASIAKYGLMREKQNESDKTDSQLKPIANTLLAELNKVSSEFSVDSLGDSSVFAGKTVQVSEKMTGINGAFYVITDSHTFNPNGLHTMSLKVSKTLDLNQIDYEAPDETSSGQDKFDGLVYETNYTATAYAPSLGGINGSGTGLTASGTKVVEGRTIAVDPSVIPLGSIVAIYVASAKEYSGIYLAEDTGGAIKGKKVDIAVKAENAMDFGVRTIQVSILERGNGRVDAREKAKNWNSIEGQWNKKLSDMANAEDGGDGSVRSNVVKLAKSYKGKLKYDFGSKDIENGTGDCSGFTLYIYQKAAGINLNHGTSSQIRKGTQIPKEQGKAGDLVFFQGTYRNGVSHVGIVTRSGYCVSLADSGCKEHSYIDGYWGSHFMEIRSVLP